MRAFSLGTGRAMEPGMTKLPLRTALTALVISASVSGCAIAGERAGNGTGQCPTGETCSELTPHGLFFVGTASTDNIFKGGLATTARGGRQTVTALTGSGSGSPAYDGDFDAKVEDAKIVSIFSVTPPSVKLDGEGLGSTRLRLLEPDTNLLLDRVEVKVAAVSSVSLFPAELMFLADNDKPWAMLAGNKASLFVRLGSAGGDRLIDENLSLSSATGSVTAEGWDRFSVEAPTKGDASFQVKAGDTSLSAKATVVASIDEVVGSSELGTVEDPIKVTVDGDSTVCFVARSGGLPVAGADWEFSLSSGVAPADVAIDLPLPSCVGMHGVTAGPAEITVKAGGVSQAFKIDVAAKASPLHHGPAQHRARVFAQEHTPVIGERAQLEGAL